MISRSSEQRLLAGALVVLAVAVSFGLTVLFFGFVVLGAALLLLIGLVLLAVPERRPAGARMLGAAGLVLLGPLIYVGLAVLP